MKKLVDFLKGKKTYIIAILAGILAGFTAYGIVIPEYVWILLGAFGLSSVRAAINKKV